MLRDDDAGHGLEHFAIAHQRTLVELPGDYCALARRLCDPDQVLLWMLHVSQVGERPLGGDGDVSVHGEMQDDVELSGPVGRHDDLAMRGREVNQRERDLVRAWNQLSESKGAGRVGRDGP